jgi:hypothetical protein
MVPTLTAALRHLRDDLADLLEPLALRELCRSLGHRWRERLLDPVTTIHLFLLQILHGNTACSHLPRLAGRSFTASAYCQARSRLPLAVLQALLRRVVETAQPLADPVGTWRGHRTWLVDGTGVSMPDTRALQRAFGQPSNQADGCGFPVARLLALFHAGTGMLQSFLVSPLRSHEMARVSLLHPELRPGDVLVGDRAFGTFAHLALLAGRGLRGLFRMAQRRVVDFTPNRPAPPRWNTRKLSGKARSLWVRSLGPTDQVVQWYKPYLRPAWMSQEDHAALPVTLTVRECRYRVSQRGFRVRAITLVTTLLDADLYPAEALADLYYQRWQVETDLAHLKTTLKMDVLRCESEEGVLKELTTFAIVYNLVRLVMVEAGRRQGVPTHRISFVDALRWLSSSPPGTPLPKLIVNPERPNRIEPRSKKRRAKKHPYMKLPRHVLRQRLLSQQVAA